MGVDDSRRQCMIVGGQQGGRAQLPSTIMHRLTRALRVPLHCCAPNITICWSFFGGKLVHNLESLLRSTLTLWSILSLTIALAPVVRKPIKLTPD